MAAEMLSMASGPCRLRLFQYLDRFISFEMPYSIKTIGLFPGGTESLATAINNKGEVTGYANVFGGSQRAFLWTNEDGLQDLGTLGGEESFGWGLNDKSEVVGNSTNEVRTQRAFFWSAKNGMTEFQTASPGYSSARDINNASLAVGTSSIGNGISHATLWPSNMPTVDLGTLGGPNSQAFGINEAGNIGGNTQRSFVDNQQNSPFITDDNNNLIPLPNFHDRNCFVMDISANNHLTGYAVSPLYGPANQRGFLWHANTGMQDIGTLGGVNCSPGGVNASGIVVGASTTALGETHAFMREFGMMHDLNALIDQPADWTLLSAYDINDRGQIVGYGLYQGTTQGFILTPVHTRGEEVIATVTRIISGIVNGNLESPYETKYPIPQSAKAPWPELSASTKEFIVLLSLKELARNTKDPKLKKELKKAAATMIKRELKKLR
jgi:probable HAF family extracellular repeat protein